MTARLRTVLPWRRRTTPTQDDTALRERLRAAADVDAGAAERAWTVVRAAHAAREPLPARRLGGHRVRALLAACAALLAGALALSPAGAEVGRWIDRAIDPPPTRPASALPAPGRLLVSGRNGTWIVEHDLRTRSLGESPEADWSAKGNYVLLTNGVGLLAVDERGGVRWTLERPRVPGRPWPRVANLAWSGGDGYRIAYRRGRQLRVANGDGSGDRLLERATAAATPSWQPRADGRHVLAYALPRGQVNVRDVDGPLPGPRVLVPPGPRVEALAWVTPERLLLLRGGGLLLIDARGRVLSRVPRPDRGRFTALTAQPAARTAAFVRRGPRGATSVVWSVRWPAGGRSRPTDYLHLLGGRARIAFAGSGTVRSLALSPDGRWLAFAWPPSDQWILQRVRGRPRLVTVERVTRRLGHVGDPADSAIVGWAR